MGGWKSKIRVGDLADGQRLEITCRRCRRLRYMTKADFPDPQQYLDEVERKLFCKRPCFGPAILAMDRKDELSGFVGGLA